jgi:hypothetical protein
VVRKIGEISVNPNCRFIWALELRGWPSRGRGLAYVQTFSISRIWEHKFRKLVFVSFSREHSTRLFLLPHHNDALD